MGLALTSQDIKNSTGFVPLGSGATRGQGPLGLFLQALDTAGEEELELHENRQQIL